jgi:hypothetical protein
MGCSSRCLHTAGAEAVLTQSIMSKIFAITFVALALSACSSMNRPGTSMGNAAETKNSTDANKAGNPAAVSPGTGTGTGTGGSGSGSGTGSGTR